MGDLQNPPMKKNAFFLLASLSLMAISQLRSQSVTIVAAENFYGGVAAQVAGSSAKVTSIMSNPNQDPHEFQTDAETAKAVANADVVIYSGIGYDSWMEKLIAAQTKQGRVVIKVADLIGAKDGDNPHIWYDPRTMPALVTKLASILNKPQAVMEFSKSMKPLLDQIDRLRPNTRGVKVTATEPVFGYMAAALGFEMLNYGFQLAVMNDTDPSFVQTADLEKSLITKNARILFCNSQVSNPATQRMQSLAKSNGIPVVGVTETQPADAKTYVQWMASQLMLVETALK
jgi:zinc/manganese transport system substrate-binding protein